MKMDPIGTAMMMAGAPETPTVHSGGGPASSVAPATVEDLAALLSNALPEQTFRLVASGTWLDAGARAVATTTLQVGAIRGVVAYIPDDLTLTAMAGTTLADIAAATRAHGQWLPLDPPGHPTGTIGATFATASCGPLAGTIGHPRDLALGVEVVDGRGERTRAGGRVVKNVAGFDLVRLQTGAWGTLGVITEVTVRLRSLPSTDRTIAVPLTPGPAAVESCLAAMRLAALPPIAAELVSARVAATLGLPQRHTLLVRFAGSRAAVDVALPALRGYPDSVEVDEPVWTALAMVEPPDACVARYSARASDLPGLWSTIVRSLPRDTLVHATVARGVVRVIGTAADHQTLLEMLRPTGVTCRGERGVWPASSLPPALIAISARLRLAFDPLGRLNPGMSP